MIPTTTADTLLTADTIADIISFDYEGNLAHNRNTTDEIFAIDQVSNPIFDEFVKKYLMSNKFNYKEIKIEYDDELQVVTYSFPSFFHLLAAPILTSLYKQVPVKIENIETHRPSVSTITSSLEAILSENLKYKPPNEELQQQQQHLDQHHDEKTNSNSNYKNFIVAYYQVNNFLPIILKSKNKIASLNKNLIVIPDGVVLNPETLTEPIFAIEYTSIHNLDKMRYKIEHSYTRFKRRNAYKTILLLVLNDNFDITVEVWRKVPLPADYDNYNVEELIKDYVNVPAPLTKENEYRKIQQAINESRYTNMNREKHKFVYYLQYQPYSISYDSCTFRNKAIEKFGIPLNYLDLHMPHSAEDTESYRDAIITLHYDKVRNLMGSLIQHKVNSLKSDTDCLSIVETIRNKAKKKFWDICDQLDFPNA